MSALGQKQAFAVQTVMSALPPKATFFASFLFFRDRQCQGNQHLMIRNKRFVTQPVDLFFDV